MTPSSQNNGSGESRYLPTTDGKIAYVAGDAVHVLTVESAKACLPIMRKPIPGVDPAFTAAWSRAADDLEAALRRLYRRDADAHETTGVL